jgi:hypothetical protein
MTEQEWLACETFWPMVDVLRKLATDRRLVSPLSGGAMLRKVQLFACAACRLGWDDLDDPRWRQAVEVAERHADGLAKKAELQKARQGAEAANRECVFWADKPARSLSVDATKVAGEWAWNVLHRTVWAAPLPLFRCVFGNPFRPATLAPEWLTATNPSAGPRMRNDSCRQGRSTLGDSPCCPTPSKRPAAPNPLSSTTCARPARTSAAAGRCI